MRNREDVEKLLANIPVTLDLLIVELLLDIREQLLERLPTEPVDINLVSDYSDRLR